MNTNVSLSNAFIQEPQTPFSAVETKLFHATLLNLHKFDKAFKSVYTVEVKSISKNYALLAEALVSLQERTWFGEPLYTSCVHRKYEGVIEYSFNPALSEHLLNLEGYYACIDVVQLEEAGLKHPVSWRILWLLRSHYRRLMKEKVKMLTTEQVELALFGGKSELARNFAGLKQHVDYAVKALVAVGVQVEATSHKRGLRAKGIKFTIPSLTLKKKTKAKKLVETVKEVAVVTTMVIAPVLAPTSGTTTVTSSPIVATPTPVATQEQPGARAIATVTSTGRVGGVGNLAGLLTRAVVSAQEAGSRSQPKPGDKYTQLYTVLKSRWQLAEWQVSLIREYANVATDYESKRYNKVRSVISFLNGNMTGIENVGGKTWTDMKNAIPVLVSMANKKYRK